LFYKAEQHATTAGLQNASVTSGTSRRDMSEVEESSFHGVALYKHIYLVYLHHSNNNNNNNTIIH